MKKLLSAPLLLICFSLQAQTIEWVTSNASRQWVPQPLALSHQTGTVDAEILTDSSRQVIQGFGGCFNELGWTSLQWLTAKQRAAIMEELFAPGAGAHFNICRMPVGANDFSLHWYSYDETPGDFDLKDFSIGHDLKTLVPFIKMALCYNPRLQLWASPWSPPTWLKYNQHYAAAMVPTREMIEKFESGGHKLVGMDFSKVENRLRPDQVGREGTDMFIRDPRHYSTYAAYFGKFIDAYKKEGLDIGMVMPQNEFNSAQMFPSCTWTAAGLSKFISYLGPEMQKRGVKVFFGTMERPNEKLVDTILATEQSGKYIQGVGFQWAGKGAIGRIHRDHPALTLYQSEQECGDGQNDWKYCRYTWELMKHYFTNGANAYMYWNISLPQGGISHWGWKQNSLVSVDTVQRTYQFNYEYYLLKHLSHFIQPGAHLLATRGNFNNLLAFINPDKSVVVVLQNESGMDQQIHLKIGNQRLSPLLKADSFSSIVLSEK